MNTEVTKIEKGELKVIEDNPIKWAIMNGASVEQLEKLMELQERHEKNEAKKSFVKAMAKFRGECKPIDRTRKGHNSNYSGLAETIEQITPLLHDCGLSHRWETKQENNQITVTCYLTHVDGHSESSTMTSPPDDTGSKNKIQAIGSAMSYLQRYTLYSVCGLASKEMDDDGAGVGVNIISDEQLADIKALIDELGDKLDLPKFNKWLNSKKIVSLEMLPAKNYAEIIKVLEGKRK